MLDELRHMVRPASIRDHADRVKTYIKDIGRDRAGEVMHMAQIGEYEIVATLEVEVCGNEGEVYGNEIEYVCRCGPQSILAY